MLLYRLVALELGGEVARVTVLLIAFCPMAYFFSAVYSESLFLALSLGCIWQARMGRWAVGRACSGRWPRPRATAGSCCSSRWCCCSCTGRAPIASRTRLRGGSARALRRLLPRYRPTPALAWAAARPRRARAHTCSALALATGDGLAPFHVQQVWFRHFAGPFGGVWDGAVAAWDGLRQLVHGPAPPIYFSQAGGNPLMVAGQNLMLFGFLVLGAVALRRRVPAAAVRLRRLLRWSRSRCRCPTRSTPQPLMSLPRYEVVLFPLFMWGGVVGRAAAA